MVFTVSCPECRSEFPVDSAKVPEEGVYAQCSMCPGVFLVERPAALVAEPAQVPAAPGPERDWSPAVAPEAAGDEVADATPPEDPDDWVVQAEAADETDDEAGFDEGPGEPASVDAAADAPDEVGDRGAGGGDGQSEGAPQEPRAAPAAVAEPRGFGQSDPDARAARLARVLVSDMMTYNPAMYEKAVAQGTLAEDFQDEVKRSWSEYVEQVGEELARSTPHFTRALNDILAKGEDVFEESMYE